MKTRIIQLLGEIAALPARRRGQVVDSDAGLWLFEESVDSLRTGITLSEELEIRQQISEDPLRWDLRPGTQAKDVPNYLVTEYLKQMLDFGLEHSLREGR